MEESTVEDTTVRQATCLEKAAGQPHFVLLAQDKTAAHLVAGWAHIQAWARGQLKGGRDEAAVEEDIRNRMRAAFPSGESDGMSAKELDALGIAAIMEGYEPRKWAD